MPTPARPGPAGTTPATTGPGAPGPNRGGRHDTSHPHRHTNDRRRAGTRRPCSAACPSCVAARSPSSWRLRHARPSPTGGGAPTLSGVIDNLRNWIVGILAGVATLFLTIGGLRYLTAGGDPGQVEKAKTALKSAAIGYALAILAPLLVSILASMVGG